MKIHYKIPGNIEKKLQFYHVRSSIRIWYFKFILCINFRQINHYFGSLFSWKCNISRVAQSNLPNRYQGSDKCAEMSKVCEKVCRHHGDIPCHPRPLPLPTDLEPSLQSGVPPTFVWRVSTPHPFDPNPTFSMS